MILNIEIESLLVFTLLKRGREGALGGKCQVCVSGSIDILRRQIGGFYTSKLPVVLHLMPKEVSAALSQMWPRRRPVGGTLTLLQPVHRATLSTCGVIVNH